MEEPDFAIAEALVKVEIVANVLRDALKAFIGEAAAARVTVEANEAADSWLRRVSDRARAIASGSGMTTSSAYYEVLWMRAAFGDIERPLFERKPGPKKRLPEPRAAWVRYNEIFDALWSNADPEALANKYAPGRLTRTELVALYSRPKAWIAARLAAASLGVSVETMQKKLLPAARAERKRKALELAKSRREAISIEQVDERSIANDDGDWTLRNGQWFFRPWVRDKEGRIIDLGPAVKVKGPGVRPLTS
jgi:hypothetical protein